MGQGGISFRPCLPATAVKQADADTLAAREQADADIAQADRECNGALTKVATLEGELAVRRD